MLLANGLKAFVTEIEEERFKIDANPPLAGASYQASVKLLGVEEGPVESVYPAEDTSSRFEVATIALGIFSVIGRLEKGTICMTNDLFLGSRLLLGC